MRNINFAIRIARDEEAKSLTLIISNQPNSIGLYSSKIIDDTLTEIFSITKENYTECEREVLAFLKGFGQIVNIHEIRIDEETKLLIEKIKRLNNEQEQ